MAQSRDWSMKHGLIRIAMAMSALAVFFTARIGVTVAGDTILGFRFPIWVTRDIVAFWLALAFLYFLLHFVARTRAERPLLAAQSRRMHRATQRIDDLRKRTGELFRSFDGALLAERFSAWDEAIRRVSLPHDNDEGLGSAAAKLEMFKGVAERIREVLDDSQAIRGGEIPPGAAEARRQDDGKRLLLLLDRMDASCQSFERGRSALESALADTREALADARRFFSDEHGHGAEDLHAKLGAAMSDIEAVRRELVAGGRAYALERNLFSVSLPLVFSLAFVLASSDAVLRGAAASVTAAATFMSGRFAVIAGQFPITAGL